MTAGTTRDGFLNSRIFVDQPKSGFRAGHDSVLLAAAVPARGGEHLLELGAGAGVASLCLAARVPECRITGIERDPGLAALANDNAQRNGMGDRVRFIQGDATAATGERFDHVFYNPPFHPRTGQVSATEARDRAMRDSEDALVAWTAHAMTLLRETGIVTVILRADRIDELRPVLRGHIELIELLRRVDEPAKRAILRLRPAAEPGFTRLPPLILHRQDGSPTEEAEAILRQGAGLALA